MAKLAEDLPGHQHCPGGDGPDFCLSTSTHPSQHHVLHQEQLPGSPAGRQCPAVQGSHRESSERVFSWVLQPAVPGAEEDMGSASSHRFVYFESAPGGAALHDGDSGVRSRRRQERMDYLHRHKRNLWRQKVLTIQGQQEDLPIHLSTLRIGNFTSRFTKLLRPVVAWLRQRGVELHVYFWLIHAESPKQAQLHAEMTITLFQQLGWVINFEKLDLTPSQDFQFLGMQFNTRQFTLAPLLKMRLKIQSVHQHWMTNPVITACDLHSLLGMVVFMALLVRRGRLRLWPVQWWATTAWCQRTGNWSDRITVPQWVLQEVAWWASPAVLQGRPLATQETEITFFTDASQLGLGSPTRLMLNTGTVVCISKIVAHTHSGDAGHHQAPEWISVPGIAHGSSSTGIEPSRTSWEAIYGSWRLLKRLTHKQTETMKIESQPMKSECCQDYGLTTVR